MVTTRIAFTALVVLVAVQRLVELGHSRRNSRALRLRGAREHATWQVPMLALLHGAWLAGMCLEVWLLDPPFRSWLAVVAILMLAAGQLLRLTAIRTLGERWTIGVWTLPNAPRVTTGIYRYIRHPNYLGVILEIASLPLVHGAVYAAVFFSAANLFILSLRVRAEEQALGG